MAARMPSINLMVDGVCTSVQSNTSAVSECCSKGTWLGDIPRNSGMLVLWRARTIVDRTRVRAPFFLPGDAHARFRRAAVVLLFWIFMGVAIGADAFMSSIETITSQTRVTTVLIRGEKKRLPPRVATALPPTTTTTGHRAQPAACVAERAAGVRYWHEKKS